MINAVSVRSVRSGQPGNECRGSIYNAQIRDQQNSTVKMKPKVLCQSHSMRHYSQPNSRPHHLGSKKKGIQNLRTTLSKKGKNKDVICNLKDREGPCPPADTHFLLPHRWGSSVLQQGIPAPVVHTIMESMVGGSTSPLHECKSTQCMGPRPTLCRAASQMGKRTLAADPRLLPTKQTQPLYSLRVKTGKGPNQPSKVDQTLQCSLLETNLKMGFLHIPRFLYLKISERCKRKKTTPIRCLKFLSPLLR